jgi:hypothetical protein
MTTKPRILKAEPQGSALVVDLTRLYLKLRKLDIRLDYRSVVEVARDGGPEFEKIIAFTSSEPKKNEGQSRLLERLRADGWCIDEYAPRDAALFADPEKLPAEDAFRFDAALAFALGRLAGTVKRIALVTDSYALHIAADECVRRGTKVALAFFREELDPRWSPRLGRGHIGFIEINTPGTIMEAQGGGWGTHVSSALSALE